MPFRPLHCNHAGKKKSSFKAHSYKLRVKNSSYIVKASNSFSVYLHHHIIHSATAEKKTQEEGISIKQTSFKGNHNGKPLINPFPYMYT
jgi:hypothetical protein